MGRSFYYYYEISAVKQTHFTQQIGGYFRDKGYIREDNLWLAQSPEKNSSIEGMYHALRDKEGWIYPNTIVEQLPIIGKIDPHSSQWLIRKNSLHRLAQYLITQYPGSTILDVGCGNGWMTNGLVKEGFQVCAIDLNYFELRQAASIFRKTTNAIWLYGNILSDIIPHDSIDCVVMASSMQYFMDIEQLMESLFQIVRDNGEIHIIDTPFYSAREKDKAAQRSTAYFASIGHPDFADHYFHRTYDELRNYSFRVQYHPNRVINKVRNILGQGGSPFPWIVIQKS
jgi:ubiquinone/menaquinone biosynthesis C-methylase UbiE